MTSLRTLLLTITLLASLSANAGGLADITQLYKKGKKEEALTQLNTFLASLPKGAWGRNVTQARMLKGVILAELKRTDEAIIVYTRLTLDYPDLPEPYNNLAALYASQGKYEAARDSLQRALRTDPTYATLHANLSDIYAKLSSQAYEQTLQTSGDKTAPARIKELCDNYGNLASQAAGRNAPTRADADFTLLREIQASRTAAAKPPAHVDIDEMAMATDPAPAGSKPATAAQPEQPVAKTPEKSEAMPNSTPDKEAEAQVIKTVQAWANAWSRKNVGAYLGFYAPSFNPPDGASRSAWSALRRERISKPKSIRVSVSSPQVTFTDASHARVTFQQAYRSDTLQSSGRKTLLMVKHNGKWQIQEEKVGG